MNQFDHNSCKCSLGGLGISYEEIYSDYFLEEYLAIRKMLELILSNNTLFCVNESLSDIKVITEKDAGVHDFIIKVIMNYKTALFRLQLYYKDDWKCFVNYDEAYKYYKDMIKDDKEKTAPKWIYDVLKSLKNYNKQDRIKKIKETISEYQELLKDIENSDD